MPLRRLNPMQQNPAASADPGSVGLDPWGNSATTLGVVTVNCPEATVPAGVITEGENLQLAPVGSPTQARETGEANPFSGVTITVATSLCPDVTVSVGEERATEKVGAAGVIV